MLDLCRFKEVNDTLGHNVGDRVLCDVAQRFQQTLGDRGLIARIGGDEFTVVLDQPASTESISAVSQLLSDCLRAPIDVAGISIEIGVSIGIARYPQDASDAQTLLRHADVAMYVAKRRGAAYEYYDAAHDENTVRKLAIGGELRARHRQQPARAALPAAGEPAQRHGRKRRGAVALDASDPGRDQPDRIHRDRRSHRPDPAAHRVDVARRAHADPRAGASVACTCASP